MSAGPILNDDGSMTLEVSVHDITGTCHKTIPVRLGPYFDPARTNKASRAVAEQGLPTEDDIAMAIKAALKVAIEADLMKAQDG